MNPPTGNVVLIVEPHSRGHRLHYVRFLVEHCRLRGDDVVILTTCDAVESTEWRVHLAEHDPTVILQPPHEFRLRDISANATALGASITILPDADGYLSEVLRRGWTGPGRLTLLVMRGEVQPGPPLAWLRPAKTLVKRALVWGADHRKRVTVYILRSALVRRRGPLRWVPEPVHISCSAQETQALRESLDRSDGRYWLGVYGDITERKNLGLIVEAIRDMPDIGLLTAGPIDERVARVIAPHLEEFLENGGAAIQIGGPLSDAEFDCAISAVDCVIAAHSNEGPSSVVLKAAASGRRLVLAGANSLRKDAQQLGSQATWTPLDVDALRRAIRQARLSPEPNANVEAGYEDFVRALVLQP